ncbi:MAG: SH3 domain-containing protein [Candidatus Nanopelagicales bacterium]
MTDPMLPRQPQRPSARSPKRASKLVATLGVTAAAGAVILSPAATPSSPGDEVLVQAAGVADEANAQEAQARIAKAIDRTSRSMQRAELAAKKKTAAAEKLAKKKAARKAAKKKAAQRAAERRAAKKLAAKKAAAKQKALERAAAKEAASATVVGTRYATVALNVRTAADSDANVVTVLDTGDKVKITDENEGNWQQIVADGKVRWVNDDYLARSQPAADSSSSGSYSGGISGIPCPAGSGGSGVEGGIGSNATRVHRAVCARFPQITEYGGYRAGSQYHGSGRALDIMVSDSALRSEIAHWVRANASALGVMEVIYSQQIWTVQRSGEGWRGMSDRGSITDNHYDHVHVTVY